MSHPSVEAQIFRLRPWIRRCAIYGLIGSALVIAEAWWITLVLFNQRPGIRLILGPILFCTPYIIPALFLLRWQLRVDEEGISRRRIFRRELWPWRAFEQGLIHKDGGGLYTYKWPGKPWWERGLTFALLKGADCDYLWKLSQQFWKPPPLPEIPFQLDIEFFGFEPRKVASFAPEGFWFGLRGQTKFYEWGEVERLLIVRWERDRHDFQKLEMTLPDQTMTCQFRKGNSPNWSGAPAAVIVRMLQHYVVPDCTEIYALTGPPTSLGEATYRLDEFKRRTSGYWQGRAIMRSLVVITLAGFAIGIFKLAVALFMLGLLGLSLLTFRRTQKIYAKEQEELEAQIAKFAPAATPFVSQEASIP